MGTFVGSLFVALSLGWAAGAGACGSAEADTTRRDSSRASASRSSQTNEARTAVERGALLLDVRTPEEFQAGHVAGATNIPVGALAGRVGEIASGREVVVYCRSGRRSAAAAEVLRERGHKVIDIGSMEAW